MNMQYTNGQIKQPNDIFDFKSNNITNIMGIFSQNSAVFIAHP